MGKPLYNQRVNRARACVVNALALPRGSGDAAEQLYQLVARRMVAQTPAEEWLLPEPPSWTNEKIKEQWANILNPSAVAPVARPPAAAKTAKRARDRACDRFESHEKMAIKARAQQLQKVRANKGKSMAALKKKALWQLWSQQTGTEQQVWINLTVKDLPRRRDRDTNGQFVRGAIDDEVPLAAIIEHATLFKPKEAPELVVPTKFTKLDGQK